MKLVAILNFNLYSSQFLLNDAKHILYFLMLIRQEFIAHSINFSSVGSIMQIHTLEIFFGHMMANQLIQVIDDKFDMSNTVCFFNAYYILFCGIYSFGFLVDVYTNLSCFEDLMIEKLNSLEQLDHFVSRVYVLA